MYADNKDTKNNKQTKKWEERCDNNARILLLTVCVCVCERERGGERERERVFLWHQMEAG